MQRLIAEQQRHGVGELDLAALPRTDARQRVEDGCGEDVAADHAEVRRRLLGLRLLDEVEHAHEVIVDDLGARAPVVRDLVERELLKCHDRRAEAGMHLDHLLQQRHALVHDVVAQHDGERLVAHVLPRHRHRVAQTLRISLPEVVDVGHVGDLAHRVELGLPPRDLEVVLELEGAVEVVLATAFPAR